MPNHVYNTISIEDPGSLEEFNKQKAIMHKIHDTGICQYFKPKPKVLSLYRSPVKIVSESEYLEAIEKAIFAGEFLGSLPVTEKLKLKFERKYGYTNWYDWCCSVWGTKWGAYDPYINEEGDEYSFSTAWSTVNYEIIKEFSKIVPNFEYSWVEEQGFGAKEVYENGELVHHWSFDTPEFKEAEEDIFKDLEVTVLTENYRNLEGEFEKGYYYSYDLQEFLGTTAEEAHKCLTSETTNYE
jgi:hypothetical protein|tara:strand:- start:31500 stop:32219 length:720 start_codon:yes stop_codon:yes gene_type:complete